MYTILKSLLLLFNPHASSEATVSIQSLQRAEGMGEEEREKHQRETRGLAASHVHPGPWVGGGGVEPATQVCVLDPKWNPPPSSAQANDALIAEPCRLGLEMSSVPRKQPCS